MLCSGIALLAFFMDWTGATSAPQQAAAAAFALAFGGIPYFIARAASAIGVHSQLEKLLKAVEGGEVPKLSDVADETGASAVEAIATLRKRKTLDERVNG
jgi:hypothetical protein